MKRLATVLCLFLVLTIAGCAGMTTALKYRDLEMNLDTGREIFLPEIQRNKIALRVTDSTDTGVGKEVAAKAKSILVKRGYVIVEDKKQADFIIYPKLSLIADKLAASELHPSSPAGGAATGAVGGALVGASSGDVAGTLIGAGVGAIAGGIGSTLADNLVSLGTIRIKGEVEVKEKLDNEIDVSIDTKTNAGKHTTVRKSEIRQTKYQSYRGDFLVKAKQTNLDWQTCTEDAECYAAFINKVALGITDPFPQF